MSTAGATVLAGVGIGDDYVAKAFDFAHEPIRTRSSITTSISRSGEAPAWSSSLQDLGARTLRIDGVGNQAHWRLDTLSIDEIETARPICMPPD